MAGKVTHKWAFKPGMRAGAYSWKSSAKAIDRLKSASTEIRAVARTEGKGAHRARLAVADGGGRAEVDTFFCSLAEEDEGENAVCIILAGTGTDGTLGLGAVICATKTAAGRSPKLSTC